MKIAVLNGPNLNLLGTREPDLYGRTTLAEIEGQLHEVANEIGVTIVFAQFNHEGDMIDAIHALGGRPAALLHRQPQRLLQLRLRRRST